MKLTIGGKLLYCVIGGDEQVLDIIIESHVDICWLESMFYGARQSKPFFE